MAIESQSSDPKRGHTIPAVEQPVEKTEEPVYPIDVAKLTQEQRNKIAEEVRNFEKLNQMIADNNAVADANEAIEKKRAQATAAGGGMLPPMEPANEKATESNQEKLDRMIAGNDAMIANNISQEKMMAAANAEPAALAPAKAPVIPPQTEPNPLNPAFENRSTESMLDTAARLGKNAAEYMGEKMADNMQYGFLGALEPKLDRLGIKLMSGPRRLALGLLHEWRNRRASHASMELADANKKVTEMRTRLATEDAKRDAFIASERASGNNIANITMKLEDERSKAVARLRKAEQDRDTKQASLESLNGKKALAENQQKDVARDMVSKVNLHPKVINANADFIALTKHKENITNQLGLWESARTKATEQLAKLEADLKSNGISYTEEEEIIGQIDEIKKILEEGNKKYKDYVGRKNAADARMGKINTYLSGWNTFKNELGRTGQDNRYDNAGEQAKVAVAGDRTPTMSNAPQA
ncbi:MAG TPA: hypothetical protein VN665_03550 [Candidatus Paceibacterota bacterium]|nr:hypothetical protein [Candidatus Paceibacterota bacterium]